MRHLFWVTRSEKQYFCSMYVRLKTNRSGSTTVVVVEKKAGSQVYVKSIGTSSNPDEIAFFFKVQDERYIEEKNKKEYPKLDFEGAREQSAKAELKATEAFLSLRVVQLVHLAVDVVEFDVLVEVGLQVFHGRRLAHGLADTRNNQMAKDVVLNGIEPDAFVDASKDDLRGVL